MTGIHDPPFDMGAHLAIAIEGIRLEETRRMDYPGVPFGAVDAPDFRAQQRLWSGRTSKVRYSLSTLAERVGVAF